jgi:hypothetical protein
MNFIGCRSWESRHEVKPATRVPRIPNSFREAKSDAITTARSKKNANFFERFFNEREKIQPRGNPM